MATALGPAELVDLAVMAKAPVPGFAKTRLIPALGASGAARLQRELTLRTLHTLQRSQLGPTTLWCAPNPQDRFFRALQRRHALTCLAQCDADLGQRMWQALTHYALRRPCLLVGTDCPALTPSLLKEAAHALTSGMDAVFVPVQDGGYALVGLRVPLPSLFVGVQWSTEQVMQQTRDRLRAAGARWHETEPLWDLDTPTDLARLNQLALEPLSC